MNDPPRTCFYLPEIITSKIGPCYSLLRRNKVETIRWGGDREQSINEETCIYMLDYWCRTEHLVNVQGFPRDLKNIIVKLCIWGEEPIELSVEYPLRYTLRIPENDKFDFYFEEDNNTPRPQEKSFAFIKYISSKMNETNHKLSLVYMCFVSV